MANPNWTGGNSGNPKGRPKGAENKETKRIREWIGKFLENNLDKLEEDITSLDPKDRVKAISDLMEYAVPKLARVENVGDEGGAIQIRVLRHGNTNTPEQPSLGTGTNT